jgi:hypothetical protein
MEDVRRILALIVLVGACTPTREFGEIEQPAYWWRADDGLCGHNLVIDRDHVLWGEGGCETGPQDLRKRHEITVEEYDAVVQAFARLPKPGPFPRDCRGVEHQFSIGQRDTGRVWGLCAPKSDFWDEKPVPEPYREVVVRFKNAATSR